MDKTEITKQIKNAFDFIQKLYNESSYLIKEIEGQLAESEYKFQFLRTSGYSISGRKSTGLEPNYVNLWLLRKFSIAFVEEIKTKLKGGQNFTKIDNELKVLYFRIILNDNLEKEPQIMFGTFYDLEPKKDWITKFEKLMGLFEYIDNKLFAKFPNVNYEDSDLKIKGKFKKVNLLEINSSNELIEKVINPAIKIYKGI